jgi:hypothetical protein
MGIHHHFTSGRILHHMHSLSPVYSLTDHFDLGRTGG